MAVEGVVGVGDCWGWAWRLQGWVARKTRREERTLEEKECMEVIDLVLVIAVEK